jgi:hypothetical protein
VKDQRFCFSRNAAVLFAVCSMMPEPGQPSAVGQPGWLPFMPDAEAMRRAHKIVCQNRYKTAGKAHKATRRFRRAFPELWAVADKHVRQGETDDAAWLDAPLSPAERALLRDVSKGKGEPW